jgi:ergothioneine biosynthesis protein EgtB
MSIPIDETAQALRQANPAALAGALAETRQQLLAVFSAYESVLPPSLAVPYAAELNPPLWELGHIGWFEEWWLARNPHRLQGTKADPDVARAASLLHGADAMYNSSNVEHTSRWHLPLPDARRTRRYLAQVRERTLALLVQSAADDDALYFFRLALMHELMHLEAWAYMAQNLALDIGAALQATQPAPVRSDGELAMDAARLDLGRADAGFAFDNELGAHEVAVEAFTIDRSPVTWQRYLPFVEAGGYDDESMWTPQGWAWRKKVSNGRPRYLRSDEDATEDTAEDAADSQAGGPWQRACFGHWVALDLSAPAVNLSLHEVQAWCRWAGRRLPLEAEWELAANTATAESFEWGQVWEWTASAFAPWPGFEPHPYRDYSLPWFDGRPVLRGASFATAPGMKHRRYRNYFTADRNDIFAGFRSCAA